MNSDRSHASVFKADQALTASVRLWFSIAVIGQLVFAAYIFSFYWLTALAGNFDVWTEVIPKGILPEDPLGNSALIAHVMLAAIITIGGPLQLVPAVRRSFPRFHRWNGRVYLFTALVTALSGLYMLLTRGAVGNSIQHVANGVSACLIVWFAILALRNALKRDIAMHRRWALRLFLVVSGTWYFRVGVMGWLAIFQKPVGIDFETFTGPTLYFLAYAQYLLPLLVLELYFRARSSPASTARYFVAGIILLGSAFTALGVFAATAGMWLPKILVGY